MDPKTGIYSHDDQPIKLQIFPMKSTLYSVRRTRVYVKFINCIFKLAKYMKNKNNSQSTLWNPI